MYSSVALLIQRISALVVKDSPKNHKIPAASRRPSALFLDSFSISSDSDDPIPSSSKSRPKPTKQRPVADPDDIIDLCSDDDEIPVSPSRPVRMRMEDNVFVILSTDDEMSSAPAPAHCRLDKHDSPRALSPVSSVIGEVLRSPSEYDMRTTAPVQPEPEQIVDTLMSPPNHFQPELSPLVTEPVFPLQVVYDQALADSCTKVLIPVFPCSVPRQSFDIIYSDTPSHPPIHAPLFFANSIFRSASESLFVVNDEPVSPITHPPSSHPEPKEEEEGMTSSASQVPLSPYENNHVALNEEECSPSQTAVIYKQAYVEGLRLKEMLAELRQPTTPLAAQESGEMPASYSGHVSPVPPPQPTAPCSPETNNAFATSETPVFDSGLSPLTVHTHLSGHYLKPPATHLRSNTSPDSNTSKDTSVSSLDTLEDSPGPSTPVSTLASQNIPIGCFTDTILELDLDLDLDFVGKGVEDDDDDDSLSGLELVYPDAPLVG